MASAAVVFHEDGRVELEDRSDDGAGIPKALLKAFALQHWMVMDPAAFAAVLDCGATELRRRAGLQPLDGKTDDELINGLQAVVLGFIHQNTPDDPQGASTRLQAVFDATLAATGFSMPD